MTNKSTALICVASALSFCFLASAQPPPSTPASAEIKVGDAAFKISKGETNGSATTPKSSAIPEEFKPIDDESMKLADSVDQALVMVKKAVTDKNKEELQKGLDELISRIKSCVTKIETGLEPESRLAMERAQIKARELKAKVGTLGLTPQQQKRWADMASTYEAGAQSGVDIIKKMQDTRVELNTYLKSAENEKELVDEEIALMFIKNEMMAVEHDMENIRLRIRGLVISISAWRSN